MQHPAATVPHVTTVTTWEINVADQLTHLQRDYIQLFTDVGAARRAETISDSQLASINLAGNRMRVAIDAATAEFKMWQTVRDEPTRQQVITLVLVAVNTFSSLLATKSQLVIADR